MPNWVFNSLSVSGSTEDLAVFKDEIAKPHDAITYDFETRTDKPAVHESHLSFWNAIAPTDLETYWAGSNWYDWNVEHWGVKWDASSVEVNEVTDSYISYNFETPWSIPLNAMKAMSAKYPNLTFDLYSEEEQGWGAEIVFKAGEDDWVKEWDIPQCHADYVDLDRECSVCESGLNTNDIEYWFDDCPRPDLTENSKAGTVVL